MNSPSDSARALLRKSPVLFGKLLAFNYSPASYLHPARRKHFFGGVIPDVVWQEPRAQDRLSPLILQDLSLTDKPCFDFPHPKWVLALLPPARLQRFARHVGAIVLGARIRSSLAREEVLMWKDKLGQDAFQFAMHSARLLPSIKILDGEHDKEDVAQIGYGLIAASLTQSCAEMQQRALLKMPPNTTPSGIETRSINQILQAVLLTLEAEWHSSFAAVRS